MSCSLQHIIVPIDFSINAETALKKAVSLADHAATIHLLHVTHLDGYRRHFFNWMGSTENTWRLKTVERLNRYKALVCQSEKNLFVKVWITRSWSTQAAIENKAKSLGAQLIVIGKKNNHSLFPFLNTVTPARLAKRTGAAVLTVKPGATYNRTKRMIVPITSENTDAKLEMIQALSKKFPLQVHLVTFIDSNNKPVEFYASSLLRAYQWLKTTTHCSIEYCVLHGRNKARVLLDYAQQSDADVLLVHPETETRMNWRNVQISDMLPKSSKVEVLAVGQDTMTI